ncbi:MAG: hypothetical protein GTO03_07125 [Planctomycetales bacterium]|nr:hypothetical protein [Planctomycetales bacterium]
MAYRHRLWPWCLLIPLSLSGCASPYYADRGAVTGGLLGGGMGAVIGSHSGNAAEGALLGGALGALTGAAVGSSLDEIDARNRALIAAHMGRPPAAGAVPLADVIAMSQAGVSDQLIITHIQTNGVASPPSAAELITLTQAGVSDAVAQALQAPAPSPPLPPPVLLEPHPAGPWQRPCRHSCRTGPPLPVGPPGLSVGVAFSN